MHGLKPAIAKRVTPPKPLGLGLNLSTKEMRKREFLDEMDWVVPWSALAQIVEPHRPRPKTGGPLFAIETTLHPIAFNNGLACATRRWKRRCTMCRCTVVHSPGRWREPPAR